MQESEIPIKPRYISSLENYAFISTIHKAWDTVTEVGGIFIDEANIGTLARTKWPDLIQIEATLNDNRWVRIFWKNWSKSTRIEVSFSERVNNAPITRIEVPYKLSKLNPHAFSIDKDVVVKNGWAVDNKSAYAKLEGRILVVPLRIDNTTINAIKGKGQRWGPIFAKFINEGYQIS